jgi:hypothetical protein
MQECIFYVILIREERCHMKLFIILNNSLPKNEDTISLISAFVRIDSIGLAEDLPEALEHIRQRHPNAPIFNSTVICSEEKRDLLISLLKIGRSIIILPRNYTFRSKCTYLGVDVASGSLIDFGWAMSSLDQIIHKCHAGDDKPYVQE